MKVAVTTPTGNIGRTLTGHLLDRGADVVLLARDPAKVREFTDRGATVHQGTLDDESYVIAATTGVDALFWLTPANYGAEDFRAYQKTLGKIAAAAVTANKIGRVVDLSSIGAHHASGTGPIAGLHDVEKALEGTGANVTHLRPAYFMENFLFSAESIVREGAVFLPAPATMAFPMIATTDIGKAAADRILDESWSGTTVLELIGPKNVSLEDATATISKGIGRDIKYVAVTPEQAAAAMTSNGMGDDIVKLYVEMYGAFTTGKIAPETSNPVKTATTFDSFVANVFRPGFEAMTK